jgi:hypothetical protein
VKLKFSHLSGIFYQILNIYFETENVSVFKPLSCQWQNEKICEGCPTAYIANTVFAVYLADEGRFPYF